MSVAASKTQIHLGGVVVINTPQLHSSKSELRFCRGLSPAQACWQFAMVRSSDNSSARNKPCR